jgi:hypothetical protein
MNINKSIQQIIDKTSLEKNDKKTGEIIKWNKSKDNNLYDEELVNIYAKTYIYNQYITKDDTIKVIKNKISCGYEKSEHFNKSSPNFIPSRLYLWSEYSYLNNEDKIINDKIMLGQKWIKRSEILELEIEPSDNIRNYEILKGNLKFLQENIRKYASKITFENDEQIIYLDYLDYITSNEIYMIDIYNELGSNYDASVEYIKNLYDVYVKIYFPLISYDRLDNIIQLLLAE